MTSDLEPERLRARLVELLDPQSVPKRARRMAQRGSRTLRGKRVRGAASGPPRDRGHDRSARDDRPEWRSSRQDPFGRS